MNNVEAQIIEGDFASGVRAQVDGARRAGDFAVGLRTTLNPMVVEDFATGMRSLPVFDRQRGDFATGQRSRGAIAAAKTTRPPVWHAANPLAHPGQA